MKFIEMKENEILGIVEPIMDNCLNGSNEDNHAKHTRDFTERMRKIVTPENLNCSYQKNLVLCLLKENLYIFLGGKVQLVSFGNNIFLHQMTN